MATSKKSQLRAGAPGERLTVYLSPQMAQSLRIHCATHRTSLSQAVSGAIAAFLAKAKKQKET